MSNNKQVKLTAKGFPEMCEKLKDYQNKGYKVPMGGVRYRGTIMSLQAKASICSVYYKDGTSVVGRGVTGTIAHIINGLVPMESVALGNMYKRKLETVAMEVTLAFDEATEILVPKKESKEESEEKPKKKTKKKSTFTKKKPTNLRQSDVADTKVTKEEK